MDSLSQIVLGAACVAGVAPARERRRALVFGAVLGTLPDLDVLPLLAVSDPVMFMTWHRTLTHSLFVLPVLGLLLWWWARRRWSWSGADRGRWLVGFQLALITHPLLDAHTVYGTQLFWPLTTPPVMWSTVFIIDPLYTIPLLVACGCAWRWRGSAGSGRALGIGLLLSSAYLGWGWIAKHRIEAALQPMLVRLGLESAPLLSVPTPFNSLGWRVVLMQHDGYFEGFASALYPDRPITLRFHPQDPEFARRFARLPSVQRMDWFTHGFVAIEQRATSAVLTDLRMGMAPDYFFSFVIARDLAGRWTTVHPVEQLPRPRVDAVSVARISQSVLQAFEPRNALADESAASGNDQAARRASDSGNRSK
ncbi:MAG: metal-dependent hydrolase [Rhodanobacteraceae bacterium]|jgi:inner membrane protein|nr:metal-dependent hydrolase [Rhodanobacteraceae bacterium]MBL0042465.1 metal-dependent hydrolase [Xanthomonadales bacterium]MBP6077287.1 metal-dependent hydrolase [Xanthomonadales bacterium]MBP7623657.1 metal-dependent hydrolase [Xanthomonadales bacterium]